MAIALTEYFQTQRQAYDKVCYLWHQTIRPQQGGGGLVNISMQLKCCLYKDRSMMQVFEH